MPGPDGIPVKPRGFSSVNTPQATNDNDYRDFRLMQDGSVWVQPRMPDFKGLCAEGRYYVAMNTPGIIANSIAVTASQTGFTDTAPVLLVANGNVSTAGVPDVRIYLDQVHLHLNQVPTSATDWQFVWRIDIATRYTSGGTNLTPGLISQISGNASMASVNKTNASVYFGALVVAAATASARTVAAGQLRPKVAAPVGVIGDAYFFKFGNLDPNPTPNAGTAVGFFNIPCPPIVLGPQHSAALYIFGTANAATPSFWPMVMWGEF